MKQIKTIDVLKECIRQYTKRAAIYMYAESLRVEVPRHAAKAVEGLQRNFYEISVIMQVDYLPIWKCRPSRSTSSTDKHPLHIWFADVKKCFKSLLKIEPRKGGSIWCFITSGDNEEYPGCKLMITIPHYYLTITLPRFVWPAKEWREANWNAETIERLGRNFYYKYTERQYGFSYCENLLSIKYGIQDSDFSSKKEQRTSFFLPWLEMRHVRHSLYDLKGELFFSQTEQSNFHSEAGRSRYDEMRLAEKECPKATFGFFDFDGEAIDAATHIEEHEWLRGTSYFKFLSLFYKPMIRHSLDIQFSKETGKRKNSFKGGTIGHSIEMLPGELHEEAFRRYCIEHNTKYTGRVS